MLVVVGDSHAIALRAGLELLEAAGGPAFAERHGEVVAGQLDHGYRFLSRFYDVSGDAVEFSNERAHGFFERLVSPTVPRILRNDPRRFVFCFGFHPSGSILAKHWSAHTCAIDRASSKQYVTEAALAAFVRSYNAWIIRFLKVLQSFHVRFSVASCNPLPPECLSHWETETFAQDEILAYHNRFRDSFRKQLDALGMRYHLPPASVYDERGRMWQRMAQDRSEGDYHANAEYGRLMMEHILSEVSGDPSPH